MKGSVYYHGCHGKFYLYQLVRKTPQFISRLAVELLSLMCGVVSLDAEDESVEMSDLQLELSSFIDLDVTTAMSDRYFTSLLHTWCYCMASNVIVYRTSVMVGLVSHSSPYPPLGLI